MVVCRHKAHGQRLARCFGVEAKGHDGRRHPVIFQPRDRRLGRFKATGKFHLSQLRGGAGANQRRDERGFLVASGELLPEFRIFHEPRLQIIQLNHVITCLTHFRAVASARPGVLRDFFAKTWSTTTRRFAAAT